jgi:hypothetical protein
VRTGTNEKRLLAIAGGLWAVLWTLVGLVEIAKSIHDPGIPGWRITVLMTTAALPAVLWVLVWLRSRAYGRIALDRPARWFLRALLWLPMLAIAETVIVHGSRIAIFSAFGGPYMMLQSQLLMPYEIFKTALFLSLWLGLVLGVKTFAAWQEQTRHLLEIRKTLAEARLAQLKSQLQPHFLFNTLNAISSLMHTDIDRADRLIARLADLLRASLNLGERELVPLDTELGFLKLYSEIMTERFGGRVRVTWDVPDDARRITVPSLVLQPILENAFRHGVEASAGAQTIAVRAHIDTPRLNIAIHSSGKLNGGGEGNGIGLGNTRERLRVHYGDEADLSLASAAEGGVVTTLSIPVRICA